MNNIQFKFLSKHTIFYKNNSMLTPGLWPLCKNFNFTVSPKFTYLCNRASP